MDAGGARTKIAIDLDRGRKYLFGPDRLFAEGAEGIMRDELRVVPLFVGRDRAHPSNLRCAKTAKNETADQHSEQRTTINFLQWSLTEQLGEVSSMDNLLKIIERAGDDLLQADEYLARVGVRAIPEPAT
jgi:hypothetical protein